MDMAFAKAKSGLYMPSPGGLPGFQRQRMDQTKKAGRTVATFIGFTQFDNNANTDTSISFARPSGGVAAGDVALFVSDVWHRGTPASGGSGRLFLQAHYGRRDIAQRIRLTTEVNHLSPDAITWADTPRQRDLVGLHDPFFYDG